MKEQTKEKIAFLVVLLFCLAYLIPGAYDEVVRKPREATEKEQFELSEKYRTVDPYATGLMTFESLPGVAVNENELVLSATATSGAISIGSSHAEVYDLEEKDMADVKISDTGLLVLLETDEGIIITAMDADIMELAWKWQGFKSDEVNVMCQEQYYKLITTEEFIEWLYKNDYEIVKK